MRLADLLSDMIASGATMEAVQAVVAAAKHQDDAKEQKRREQTAARVREHRARKNGKAGNASNDGNALQTLHALQAEPAETRTHVGAPAGQITTNTTTKIIKTPPSEGQKTKREVNPRTRIASDAQPSDKDRDTATEAGMDRLTFRNEWGLFRDHHIADGSTMADWSAAWRTWVGKWVRHGSKPVRPANGSRASPRDPDQILDTTVNAAARYLQLHS